MFLDIHAIQNVPPCNINRDDTGTPKTAIYGGYLRSRVSSQAWKHAMRAEFARHVDPAWLGYRTKRAVSLVSQRIAELDPALADEADDLAVAVLGLANVTVQAPKRAGSEKEEPVTPSLAFIAASEVDGLARVAVDAAAGGEDLAKEKKPSSEARKAAHEAFRGRQALDIALFGRMLTKAPDLTSDASAQVAHAISVDRVTQEYDYFTAVDDCAKEGSTGAAMVDTTGFNSSTLYRYATLDVDSLASQLGDAESAAEGTRAFVDAFVRSMPTGKQNAFANRTLPSAVLVAVRGDQPVNGVSAFESPVCSREGISIASQAEDRLARRLNEFADAYGAAPEHAWWMAVDGGCDSLEAFGTQVTLPQMLDAVSDAVLGHVSAEG